MKTPPPGTVIGKKPGFTLVELLVVLAILAVLVALGYPALQRVRLRATAVTCASHLKQLALAHRMYEQDNQGKPPPNFATPSHPYGEGHNNPGLRLLRRYYRQPGPNGKYIWDRNNKYINEPIELCPSVRFNGLADNLANGPHYQMSSLPDTVYATYYQEPSQRPLIWDGFTNVWQAASPKVPLRHEGGILCAFLDGHVETIPAGDDRLYHRWWHYAIQNSFPDPDYLNDGTPMGSTTLP